MKNPFDPSELNAAFLKNALVKKKRKRRRVGEIWGIPVSDDYYRMRGFYARKSVYRDIMIKVLVMAAQESQYYAVSEITQKVNVLCRQRNIQAQVTQRKIHNLLYPLCRKHKEGKEILGARGFPMISWKSVEGKQRLAYCWSDANMDYVFKKY